jgi:hypothetical protein
LFSWKLINNKSQAIDKVSSENEELRHQAKKHEGEKQKLLNERRALEFEKRVLADQKRALEDEKRVLAEPKMRLIHLPRAPLPTEVAAMKRLQLVIQRDMGFGVKAARIAIDELVRCLFVLSDTSLQCNYSLFITLSIILSSAITRAHASLAFLHSKVFKYTLIAVDDFLQASSFMIHHRQNHDAPGVIDARRTAFITAFAKTFEERG